MIMEYRTATSAVTGTADQATKEAHVGQSSTLAYDGGSADSGTGASGSPPGIVPPGEVCAFSPANFLQFFSVSLAP